MRLSCLVKKGGSAEDQPSGHVKPLKLYTTSDTDQRHHDSESLNYMLVKLDFMGLLIPDSVPRCFPEGIVQFIDRAAALKSK